MFKNDKFKIKYFFFRDCICKISLTFEWKIIKVINIENFGEKLIANLIKNIEHWWIKIIIIEMLYH